MNPIREELWLDMATKEVVARFAAKPVTPTFLSAS